VSTATTVTGSTHVKDRRVELVVDSMRAMFRPQQKLVVSDATIHASNKLN
jgi:hypothetical protein